MARTSAPGGRIIVNASSTAADTAGYGIVSILCIGTGASAALDVQVGDTSTVDTEPVTTIIDPDTGDVVSLDTFTLASGAAKILSYIGEKRYIKATGTAMTVYVLLEEAAKTTPEPSS